METELQIWKSRAQAHEENYLQMLKRIDHIIAERERNAAIADLNILCDKVLELNTLLQEHGIIEYGN